MQSGLSPNGEAHGMAKLTQELIGALRARHGQGGISLAALGKEYGISKSQVFRIVTEQSWKRITAPKKPSTSVTDTTLAEVSA
jgi:DNA invertase Pin-like site-specific DNA recombinase